MKDNTKIVSVHSKFDTPIKWYDDGYGPLWVYRNSMGVAGVIRAMNWHDAYDIVLDEILTPIEQNEIPEAYGFYGENAEHAFAIACENEAEMDLTEGYQFQPNSTGTGIVSTDLNGEALDKLDSKLWKDLGLKIKIANIDRETTFCKFCRKEFLIDEMHYHQGTHVCNNCWDERLRITS